MSANVPPVTFGPLSRGERLVGIDFVRGVALLGILLVNAGSFFGPMMSDSRPENVSKLSALDLVARSLVSGLCFTKFISIFAMLFGYGLLTQVERVEASGRSPWWFAFRRLGALALIGLAHALGLWYGDVLFTYASLGLFVVIFRKATRPRDLLLLAGCFLGQVAVLRVGGEFLNLLMSVIPKPAGVEGARGWAAIVASGGNAYSDVWRNAEIEAGSKGPYLDLFTFRAVTWLMGQSSMLIGAWPMIVGLFVMGKWLYRVRFFDADRAALRRKTALICLPLGLGVEALAAVWFTLGVSGERPSGLLWAVGGAVQTFSMPFLALGYMGALATFADAVPRWLTAPVVAAGRMPLTVYLLETVVATTLAYHYGLGLFGRVGPAGQVLFALGIWAGLALLSWLWLSLFSLGPMEWLWRVLEYGSTAQRPAIPSGGPPPDGR